MDKNIKLEQLSDNYRKIVEKEPKPTIFSSYSVKKFIENKKTLIDVVDESKDLIE